MLDISIVVSCVIGVAIGAIFFYQYKRINSLKTEIETVQKDWHDSGLAWRLDMQSDREKIEKFKQENNNLKIQLEENVSGLRQAQDREIRSAKVFQNIVLELLILYRKTSKIDCGLTELEEELLRKTAVRFKFSDVESDSDFLNQLHDSVPEWANAMLEEFKEKVLGDYYSCADVVTQSTGTDAASGDLSCVTDVESEE
ncbi:hypothetical protein V6615_16420 (plasmid) [Oscillospiraceae bacterium PP1C4]